MKKKLLATAIAGAMIVPSAFAAQDTSGMQYTSASEGFYASIRVRYNSGGKKDDDSVIENSTSRIGVRGSNDLGGGLEGFYRYEFFVPLNNGDASLNTRLSHVGLRGGFGQVWVGTNWAQSYNWVSGSTDIANVGSGNLNYTTLNPGRQSQAIEYTSPDLNGFQGSALVSMDGGSDGNDIDLYILGARYGVAGFDVAVSYASEAEGINDLQSARGEALAKSLTADFRSAVDEVAATNNALKKDAVTAGRFNALYGTTYDSVAANADDNEGLVHDRTGSSNDDYEGYSVKVGYAQDNWYVNAWYHEDNRSEESVSGIIDQDGDLAGAAGDDDLAYSGKADDTEIFSIAGGVEVGKVNVYALHENRATGFSGTITKEGQDVATSISESFDDAYTTFGVQYNLGSRSRVWIEYVSQDLDSDPDADDYVNIGLRHDF